MELNARCKCNYCTRLRIENQRAKCSAFPGGIPEDILSGDNDHTKKHPKQKNDILFNPEPPLKT